MLELTLDVYFLSEKYMLGQLQASEVDPNFTLTLSPSMLVSLTGQQAD